MDIQQQELYQAATELSKKIREWPANLQEGLSFADYSVRAVYQYTLMDPAHAELTILGLSLNMLCAGYILAQREHEADELRPFAAAMGE